MKRTQTNFHAHTIRESNPKLLGQKNVKIDH